MSPRRKLSAEMRKRVMRSIRAKDTRPEMIVRRVLWRLGARYRLHANDLPGRPDIVMRRRRLAVLVHGCFWHLHDGCPLARIPRSRPDYWPGKLASNKARDERDLSQLISSGWCPEIIWECETRDLEALEQRLRKLLQ
jgi:DNA mismatch endonuclease (patch repair protein)